MTDLQKILAFALRRRNLHVRLIAKEFLVGQKTIQTLLDSSPEIQMPLCMKSENIELRAEIIMEKYPEFK